MNPDENRSDNRPTVGELFAGIGGFSLGFEAAGWRTAWQVELNAVKRAVLSDRFGSAQQFADVNQVSAEELCKVDCICAGFPCTDISNAGQSRKGGRLGLAGPRSGLFSQVLRIVGEIQPRWLVLENVPALLHSNDKADFEQVICSLADSGYVGFWRVLDAQYFGVAQKRERIFLVCGLGEMPPFELLSDAAPVESIPCSFAQVQQPWRQADDWPGYTLLAKNVNSRISLGNELFVAQENGFDQMVDRARMSEAAGVSLGMDASNFAEAFSAGDAICPEIAAWIARILYGETNATCLLPET